MIDYSDRFNTPLSAENERRYKNWLASQSKARGRDMSKDHYDYDMRGYWLNGGYSSTSTAGHFPDKYKKPNHPTFSTESIYHNTVDTNGVRHVGGQWSTDFSTFTPGTTGRSLYGTKALSAYFKKYEPKVTLKW
jgi:hypothetical protein